MPALGTNADNPQLLDDTLKDMGRTTITWNVSYMRDTDPLDTEMLNAELKRGVKHHIVTLEFMDRSLSYIVDHKGDADLQRIAKEMRNWLAVAQLQDPQQEIIVRPLHEANGDWYSWGFLHKTNRNTTQQYKQAWWHIRGVMDTMTPQLKWFWCPNRIVDGQPPFAEWYPGNENVDYVGHDAYNRSQEAGGWQWPEDVHNATIAAIQRVAPTKPYIVGETATSEPTAGLPADNTKANWFARFGTWMRTLGVKNVVAVCYLDYIKPKNDWRIFPTSAPTAEDAVAAFRAATRDFP